MYRPDLTDLDAVLAVARRASFRRAALDVGLSTTALSNAVAKLEAKLGIRLFNRTTRSVALTDAGRAFVEQVGPALEDIHAAMEAARSQQAMPSGMLRINAFATAGRHILMPLALEFLRRFPDVHVDIVTEGRLVDIVADGFDMGVRAASLVPSDMIAVSLGQSQRHAVVASPDYIETHGRPRVPTDLFGHRCIRGRLPNGELLRWTFEKGGEVARIEVKGPITLDEVSLARAAVLAGVGLGYVMEQDVSDDIAAGRLVRALEDWTPPLGALCLYYPSRRHQSAALKAFIALAREYAARAR